MRKDCITTTYCGTTKHNVSCLTCQGRKHQNVTVGLHSLGPLSPERPFVWGRETAKVLTTTAETRYCRP